VSGSRSSPAAPMPATSARRRRIYTPHLPAVCILSIVRRINIYIDEELDDRVEREAKRRNMSNAALIRESHVARLGPGDLDDPLDQLVGMSDAAPAEDIDSVIYGS
jgi:hypothetical protein